MSRTLAPGARELLYGRAELTAELPRRLAAITSSQVAEAARRIREQGRALLVVEPAGSDQSTDAEEQQ